MFHSAKVTEKRCFEILLAFNDPTLVVIFQIEKNLIRLLPKINLTTNGEGLVYTHFFTRQ